MPDPISITICGDGGCGKSSLLHRLTTSTFTPSHDPTIEDTYSLTLPISGSLTTLHVTDTAGQEEYLDLFSSSNLSSDAFLLVYSITSLASLHALDRWGQMILAEEERRREEGECWPAVMVVGNKVDLAGEREVGGKEGLGWARARGWGFMESSAREGVHVEETFGALVRRAGEARRAWGEGLAQPLPEAGGSRPRVRVDSGAGGEEKEAEERKGSDGPASPVPKKRKRGGFLGALKCC